MDQEQAHDLGRMAGPSSLGRGRAVLDSAITVLRELRCDLWQASGAQLGELLGELDQVVALASAGRVAVTLEAVQRGEVAASQCASSAAWVRQHAPALASGGGAGQVAKCVVEISKPRLDPVREAVLSGDLAVPVALVVVSEFDKLRGRIIPEAEALVLNGLVRIGSEDGVREVRRLRSRLLAEHGAQDEFQDEQDKAACQVALSHPVQVDDGVWQYLLRVGAEGKAVLEAAIGPLSAPWHPGGARDARSAQQRRAEALIEVCRRVTASAKAAGPFGGFPTGGSPTGNSAGAPRPSQHGGTGGTDRGRAAAAPGTDPRPQTPRQRASESSCWPSGVGAQDPEPPPAESQPPDPPVAATGFDVETSHAEAIAPGEIDSKDFDHWGRDPMPFDEGQTAPGDSDLRGTGPVAVDPRAAGQCGEPADPEALDPAMVQAALAGMGAGGAKANLLLTMQLTDLLERIGAATVLGTTEDATPLAPETARRIACNAGIIPVVLGSHSEVLDLGRTERLFSPAQARAVLLRDRHCSFPGCDIAAFWTQLHHVRHWVDGGPSDRANAALLCARHHTIVHRDRLTATVTLTGVTWDTVPGSYDRALAREHPSHPAA